MKSIVFYSKSGCFLPLLIFFNLFFGWMFFKPLVWLGIGAGLVFLFALNSFILARKISSAFGNSAKRPARPGAIDTEAEVVE